MPLRTSTSLLLATVVLVVALLPGCGKLPGTRSGGAPDDADYCNVLLVPAVAEEIGLDLALRLSAATKGAALLQTIRGDAPEGSLLVARHGREAREMLPGPAQAAFDRLFSSGKLVRVGYWTEEVRHEFVHGWRYYLTYGWYAEEKERVGEKSLAALERELEDCYQWIPSADVADELLDHENQVVRDAADRWWDRKEEELEDVLADQRRWEDDQRRARESREREVAFDRKVEASRRRHDAFARQMQESRDQRAVEREAFKAEVRAHQQAVREKIEAARQRKR